MKYRVGDKVRVKTNLKVGGLYGNAIFTKDMENLAGELVAITSVDYGKDRYNIEDNAYGIQFCTEEMLEGNAFGSLKSMLKPCMLVKLRNNKLYYVGMTKRGKLVFADPKNTTFYYELDSYSDDLVYNDGFYGFEKHDVMAIYGLSKYNYGTIDVSIDGRELLWQREAPKKMTVRDIQNILGYVVEIVEE